MTHLPTDITDTEITDILFDLWSEHLPDVDASFISQLTPQDARTMLDIICATDVSEKELLRKTVEARAHGTQVNMQSLLQHLTTLKQKYAEAVDSAAEDSSTEELLTNLT